MKSFVIFALGALAATVFLACAKKSSPMKAVERKIEQEVDPRFFTTHTEEPQKYLH